MCIPIEWCNINLKGIYTDTDTINKKLVDVENAELVILNIYRMSEFLQIKIRNTDFQVFKFNKWPN